jgi:hypothetical protein
VTEFYFILFSFLCKMVKFHHKKYWILSSIVDFHVYIFFFLLQIG